MPLNIECSCHVHVLTLAAWGSSLRYTALPDAAAKFSERGPTKSSAARENPVFWMLIMHGGFFLRHVTLLAIVIGHRATPKNAAPWKISSSSFHFAAQRGAASSVAPAMINSTVYLF